MFSRKQTYSESIDPWQLLQFIQTQLAFFSCPSCCCFSTSLPETSAATTCKTTTRTTIVATTFPGIFITVFSSAKINEQIERWQWFISVQCSSSRHADNLFNVGCKGDIVIVTFRETQRPHSKKLIFIGCVYVVFDCLQFVMNHAAVGLLGNCYSNCG